METKSKVMLVAAIGAVLVLVSSTAVRCTIAHIAQDESGASASSSAVLEGTSQESGEPASSGPAPMQAEGSSGAEENRPGAEESALQVLRSHAWQAEGDAETTVSFRDGAFIESNAEGIAITAFDVMNVTEADGYGTLEVRLSRDGVAEKQSSIITVEGYEGSLKVSCDGFANAPSYVQGAASANPVATSGVTEPYATLIEGKTDSLATAIAEWCRDNAPTATQASFDGEVFLDVNNSRTVATFTCDDAAHTLLSVEYANGEFKVSG